MDTNIIDNKEEKQYELTIDGMLSRIEYIEAKNKIYLTHTEVPTELKGKGIGSRLIKHSLEDIASRNMKLMPLCPFVSTYIKRHPEYRKLLVDGAKI